MKFVTRIGTEPLQTAIEYIPTEYSICPIHANRVGVISSVLVNDVELLLDSDSRIVGVSGLCPHSRWEQTPALPPPHKTGELYIEGARLTHGISHRLTAPAEWPVSVNWDANWICIGNTSARSQECIEFNKGCVAVVNGGALQALWLHPTNTLSRSDTNADAKRKPAPRMARHARLHS